ncbi:MAG: hypothetical protein SF051_13345 [Elusimicrobiota bacterium]|nr:hypothetical protein [Elusimicrobiota bacterium]
MDEETILTVLVAVLCVGLVEATRRGSSLPRWSWSAHLFSAGFLYLLRGPEGPLESLFGLGLCAAGAPALWMAYRARGSAMKKRLAEIEAALDDVGERMKRDEERGEL